MDTALGLLGLVAFIAGMLALAWAVTFAVVRLDALVRRARGRAPLQ